MNLLKIKDKSSKVHALALFSSLFLVGCGPQSPGFAILAKGQSAFQGNEVNNQVDVLFVVDNSGSMDTKQQKLVNGFGSFIAGLSSGSLDFHVAVVTTDIRAVGTGQAGIFVSNTGTVGASAGNPHTETAPKVLTNSSTYLTDYFNLNALVGSHGNANATGLDAIELALSSALLDPTTGLNRGFLRDSAHLAVITVSDADDDDSQASPDNVLNFLETVKPDVFDEVSGAYKHNFTVSAVAASSLSDPDCAGDNNIEVGAKFIALANSTDGSVASICAPNFSAGLTQISQTIIEAITQIPLSTVPDLSTLTVSFNGVAVANDATNGWTYVSSGNKILFHGTAIPTPNTSISIDFIPNDITR